MLVCSCPWDTSLWFTRRIVPEGVNLYSCNRIILCGAAVYPLAIRIYFAKPEVEHFLPTVYYSFNLTVG
jgi:hypothetical protein